MLLKTYIILCGLILICIGVLGFFAEFTRPFETTVFGAYWYSDNTQNTFHVVLGFFTFFVGVAAGATLQKILTWLFSLTSIGVAVYSLFSDTLLTFFNLEKPGDTTFYLIMGSVGLLVLTITLILDRRQLVQETQDKLKI